MRRSLALLPLVACLASGRAYSFDMNPIAVDCWGKDHLCDLTGRSEKLKFPVHETMTLLAYDCYVTPDQCSGGRASTSAEVLKKKGCLRDLELGSEWNDDPDSLLRQGITEALQWYSLFKDAKLQSECSRKPGPQCSDVKIAKNPMMLYRTSFGDLQFLHSMASRDDEPAAETKAKMLAWAKFTYNVFAEKIGVKEKLSSVPEIWKIVNKPGWTVGALFDPVPGGEWKRSRNPFKFGRYEPNGKPRKQNLESGIIVRYVALGSLLHMIQDSYSDSHAARKLGCNPLAKRKGPILAFRNYAGQKPEDHGLADVYPEWLKHGKLATENPVWATAQIISYAFNDEPWENVEKFLDTQVFALEDASRLPDSGNRRCFDGTSAGPAAPD